MVLFDGSKSILIRQHNADFLVLEKELDGDELMNSYFIVTDKDNKRKMKIAQIWEEKSNEFCLNMKVLEAKCLMFAGFEKDEK